MSIKNIEGDQRPEEQGGQNPQVKKLSGLLSKRMTRRDFDLSLAFGAGALFLGGLQSLAGCQSQVEQKPTATPKPDGTARATADSTPTPEISQLTPQATSLPKPTGVAMAEVRATEIPATPAATGTKVEAVQQLPVTQTRVPETNTNTPAAPLPARTPTATEVPTIEPTKIVAQALVKSAPKEDDKWLLEHPDGGKTEARLLPDGFIPDKKLRFAIDIKPLAIGHDLTGYRDWETALNTKRSAGPLSGYNYDYNDFCNNVQPAFQCNVQLDMYAWRVFQGQEVEVPGIGRLEGGPRRSVVLVVINLDASVHPWDPDGDGPVKVKRGFTATGRIFDGGKNVDILERNLSGHWLFRQAYGTPEKSYIGVANSPDNAKEVLLVTVQRKQWGFEQDKTTKRIEFQLIRADLVTVK